VSNYARCVAREKAKYPLCNMDSDGMALATLAIEIRRRPFVAALRLALGLAISSKAHLSPPQFNS
jgi:hypothetical protein